MFNSYLKQFSILQSSDYVTQQLSGCVSIVNGLCNHIKNAVRQYLHGFPHLAFNELQTGIESVQPYLDNLNTPTNAAKSRGLSELYRIRVAGPEGGSFQRSDLFHIPFEKRQLVTRQRYSLPGIPCLYLGGSLYIAWEELGRPNFDTVYFSRFRPQSEANINYLNFGHRPAFVASMIEQRPETMQIQSGDSDLAVANGVCWPLIAACSIKSRFGNSPFIHEYIIPQLLLQWVANSATHRGIRYFSVHVTKHMNNPLIASNFVFPVRSFVPCGHCTTLRSMFEMSSPLSWQLIERSSLSDGMMTRMPIHGQSMIELVAGTPVAYVNTPFGYMEAKTIGYPFSGL